MGHSPPNTYYEEAFEGLNDSIVVYTRETLLWCNQKFVELLGYQSSADLIGTKPLKHVSSDYHNESTNTFNHLFTTRKSGNGSLISILKKDGSSISCFVKSAVKTRSGFDFIVSIFRPFESSAVDERMIRFMNVFKHEVNTPISVILGYADMIQQLHGGTLHPEVVKFLELIMKNAQRIEAVSRAMVKLESINTSDS